MAMTTNGNGKTTRELIEELEAIDREQEIRRQVDERVEQELARHRAEQARQAEERMAGVRRSQLSPLEKSRIIRARGIDFYNSLDW
jgi:hypothetical protein